MRSLAEEKVPGNGSSPAASATPASRSRLATEAVAVFLAYVIVAAWWLWPLPAHVQDHAVYMATAEDVIHADYDLITWALAWDVHALTTGPARFFDANIFFPAKHALAFSEHFLGYLPLFAPVLLVTGNPVLAINVTLFLTFPLCGLAMYALARRFVARPPAFLAGFLFAFCGLRYFTLWHVHLLGAFWMPLVLLLTERWLERARAGDALLLSLVLLLQLLSSYYLAFALAVLYAAYLPIALWWWRAELDLRRLAGLALACTGAAIPAAAASMPYLELRDLGWIRSYAGSGATKSPLLAASVTRQRIVEYLVGRGVGWLGYGLALVAMLPPWSRDQRARLIGAVAVIAGVIAAAGPNAELFGFPIWTPHAWLAENVPGFSSIRMPRRFLVVSQLGFSLLAALGLARCLLRLSARLAWPVATACALLAIWSYSLPSLQAYAKRTPGAPTAAYHWLAANGEGRALLELPLGSSLETGRRMLSSTQHWLPMIEGYSAYPPPVRTFFGRIVRDLPGKAALQRLVDHADIGWILVHLDQLSPGPRAVWEKARTAGLERVGDWQDALLFRVTQAPRDDRRDRLFDRHQTPAGTSLQPLDACQGKIIVVPLKRLRGAEPGARVPIHVTLRNESHSTWPGFAVWTDQLVQVEISVKQNGRYLRPSEEFPLDDDLPPGAAYEEGLAAYMPMAPGAYELEVAATQGGVSLERCGLAPSLLPIEVVKR